MCCQCLLRAAFAIIDSFEGCKLEWPVCHKHLLIQHMEANRHKVTLTWRKL